MSEETTTAIISRSARLSWERAQTIADALTGDDPDLTAMRIAPRTMLCGIAFRVQVDVVGARFEELRELCATAGDKTSLAIGMAGLVQCHAWRDRIREASELASEAWALGESLDDPTLTVGLSFPVIYAKIEYGEWGDVLRWSQRGVELADGDPAKGGFVIGSPLAIALTTRAAARYCLGRPGWQEDVRQGLAMGRGADPLSYAGAVAYVYFPGILAGALVPDDSAMREIKDAVQIAERAADDLALDLARVTLGVALVHRDTDTDRSRGHDLLAEVSEALQRREHNLADLPLVNALLASETARRGDPDEAIRLLRAIVDHLFREGRLLLWGIRATAILVQTLLTRERVAAAPADDGLVIRDVWLLRMRALLAQSRGNDVAYRDLVGRYRAMAESLGFEGHIAWATEMLG